MIISSKRNFDVAQEAQLAFYKLLKAVHSMNRELNGTGVVELKMRITHSEIELDARFDDGGLFNKTEILHELGFIAKGCHDR